MKLTYIGPHDGVDVCPQGEYLCTVMRGGSFDFAEDIAENLLTQEGCWEAVVVAVKEAPVVAQEK